MVNAQSLVVTMLDSFPEPAAILNPHRQIVLANDKLQGFTGLSRETLLGLRMGEAVGCEYGRDLPNGCGTTPACCLCGAAKAIAATQEGSKPAVEDCRITLLPERGHLSIDLRVSTTPVEIEGEPFLIFAIRDTSDEQRRRVLERLFFHDVLNAAGGLRNVLQLWPVLSTEEASELSPRVANLAAQVVEEIKAQRDLAAAERGELAVREEAVEVDQLLDDLVILYSHHSVAEDRNVVLSLGDDLRSVRTDPVLLRRVLGNLVKNALEASSAGQTVTVAFENRDGAVFSVHNQTVMTEAVRLQIFQRSFSTRQGSGRGVGTYSARLLTERYLRGRLTFTSVEGEGTTFTLTLRN
jgi:nitrogen-specific signal transduction histidine kinase